MDDLGNPIGDTIGVVTYGDNPGSKHNPRVAYNSQEDVYLSFLIISLSMGMEVRFFH